ncbi:MULTISPECIES: hypothetical protein [Streptomyces]|uniref:Protein kinase G tetratricopeptide repeat containing domain-containing protein n=2 Tax=Streptomyces TaxID=1883 RepID=A0A100Y3C1_9ACTN|nr:MULTISPECIES: hypothetical protein [Streptomyces]KUH36944.1 hypothetical protein ATE80_20735 [Streptomyces kanasensis]UUS34343.1 hypothetical protein NRO40_28275 [Streptomyces changanensis]
MDMDRDPGVERTSKEVAALAPQWTPVSERAAVGLWRLPRAAEAVERALASEDPALRERGWVMVRARVAEEIDSGRDWTREAALWLARGSASWEESARVTGDLSWRARAAGRSALLFLSDAHVASVDPGDAYGRALWHCFLTTLRYDFRCAAIEEFFGRGPRELPDLDPYSDAMRVFALLGRSRTEGLPLLDSVVARAGDDDKVVHALLHGLWLGEDLPDQADRMLRLLEAPAFAGGLGPEALFRKAGALRRLRRYGPALQAVQEAIDGLDPSEVVVHADCVRERSLILADRDLYEAAGAGDRTPAR